MSTSDVKRLREITGAGILECKKALEENNGDLEKAQKALLKRVISKAAKKDSRETPEGIIGSYIHTNGKIGAMVELNCETDFVAKNALFQQIVKDICMQIAACNPLAIRREDILEDIIKNQKETFMEEASDKPKDIKDKIVEGKMETFYKEKCLLEQIFIKDNKQTIQDLISNAIAKTGEKIKINRFARFEIGA